MSVTMRYSEMSLFSFTAAKITDKL